MRREFLWSNQSLDILLCLFRRARERNARRQNAGEKGQSFKFRVMNNEKHEEKSGRNFNDDDHFKCFPHQATMMNGILMSNFL